MPKLVASGLSRERFEDLVNSQTPSSENGNSEYDSSEAEHSFQNVSSSNFPIREPPSLALQLDAAVRKVHLIFSMFIYIQILSKNDFGLL